MKHFGKFIVVVITTFIIISLFSLTISANSAEPPLLSVMVSYAPEELQIQLRSGNGILENPIITKNKGFDTFYHFLNNYDNTIENLVPSRENMSLVITVGDETFEITLPESKHYYHGIYTLNLSKRSLMAGTPLVRNAVLVTMRIILTLLIEGLIFFVFRFKGKRNWIIFFIVNLITQGGLNIILSNPDMGSGGYWLLGFFVLEILILITEIIAFSLLLKENSKEIKIRWWKPPLYAFIANIASLYLGGFLISAFNVYY